MRSKVVLDGVIRLPDIRTIFRLGDASLCPVVGAEGRGVSDEPLDLADQPIEIPGDGGGGSINLGTAASVLHEGGAALPSPGPDRRAGLVGVRWEPETGRRRTSDRRRAHAAGELRPTELPGRAPAVLS